MGGITVVSNGRPVELPEGSTVTDLLTSLQLGGKWVLVERNGEPVERRLLDRTVLVGDYGGRAEALWEGVESGPELLRRLKALPGFGDEKARIFLAVLGKRLGVQPPGWEEAAVPFSDERRRSVADATSPEALEEVRAFKRERKAAGKGKAD